MNIDHRNPRLRRGFAFVALAALLGLSVVGLSQCRSVNDTVTGVDLKANSTVSARSNCDHLCNDQFKACTKQESARHKAAKRACMSNKDCKKAEDALHKQNKMACEEQKKACKHNCYNEGAGLIGR